MVFNLRLVDFALFCFCVSRFIVCDHCISGHNQLVCFKYFSDLSYSCHLQIEQCLPPSVGKNSTHHHDFLRPALTSVFVFALFCIIDGGAEKPKIPKVQHNKFGSKTRYI